MSHALSIVAVVAVLFMLSGSVINQRNSGDSRPDLEGVWNSATVTPLERPPELQDKAFFTPEEAAEWEQRIAERNQEAPPATGASRRGTGTYNTFYREFGTRTVATRRTSIITDPPDGRIPSLTPAAEEAKRRRVERQGRRPLHRRAESGAAMA